METRKLNKLRALISQRRCSPELVDKVSRYVEIIDKCAPCEPEIDCESSGLTKMVFHGEEKKLVFHFWSFGMFLRRAEVRNGPHPVLSCEHWYYSLAEPFVGDFDAEYCDIVFKAAFGWLRGGEK